MKTVTQLILFTLSVVVSTAAPRYALHHLTPFPNKFKSQINDIQQDQLGLLWIGTNHGLFRSSGNQTKAYNFIPHDATSLRCNGISNLTLNHNGRLLVGTDCGLHRYVKSRNDFEYYTSPIPRTVSEIQEDIDGYLWFWSGRGFGRLYHEQGGIPELEFFEEIDGLDLSSLNVIDFCITPEFEMWLATSTGLVVVDIKAKGRPRLLYKHTQSNTNSGIESLMSIERDINGRIWLGSKGGLYVFKGSLADEQTPTVISHYPEYVSVNDLFLASNGDFYFVNGNRVAVIDHGDEINMLSLNYGFEWPKHDILQIKGDRLNQGNFFLITRGDELHYLEKADIGSKLVTSEIAIETRQQTSWDFPQLIMGIGQDSTLLWRTKDNENWQTISDIHNIVLDVIQSQSHLIAILKNDGCLIIDAEGRAPNVTHLRYDINDTLSIPSNQIFDIHFLNGILYIATAEGLVKRRLENDQNYIFNEANGLPGHEILSITEDGYHRLWVLTDEGLAIKSDTSDSFFHVAGPYGPDITPFCLRADEEKVFIKSRNEWLELDYDDYAPRREIVPVRIEYLEDASGLEYNLLHRQPDFSLEVPYEHNSIKIEFITILPITEYDYRYRYELNGQHQQNETLESAKSFSLNSLPSGDYDLTIQVLDERGQLCGQDHIAFSILPPFWLSTKFFIITGGFLLSLIVLYFLVIYQQEKRRREDIRKVKKKAAADFHDELGSRLAVISLYANMIQEKNTVKQGEVNDYLKKVLDSANELYFAMKDVIWTLKPEAETLTGLLDHLESLTNRTFLPSGIDVEISRPSSALPDRKLDPVVVKNISLISREVMNNTIRHSKCQNFIFSSQVLLDGLKLCWKDDGKGIDEEAEKGEGLENLKMRARKIGGVLTIDSGKHGTKVCLNLTF